MTLAKSCLISGLCTAVLLLTQPTLFAQSNSVDSLDASQLNWQLKDITQDNIPGASIAKAYQELLAGKKPKKKIVVAIIDSGVDIEHEDLQGKIWTNEDEIPNNGKDDDNNGYVDDVHGWNYLGGSNGENVDVETYEMVRLVRDWQPRFQQYASAKEVPKDQKADYEIYEAAKNELAAEILSYNQQKELIQRFIYAFQQSEMLLQQFLKKEEITLDDVLAIQTDNEIVQEAKGRYILCVSNNFTPEGLKDASEEINKYLEKHLNLSYNPRELVGDDHKNIEDKGYGNNDVEGPDAFHGTFVAGIIGATRNNGIGVDGIADHVEMMVLRAVPDGDEYDKDVALAIRYAVDNGANVVNMSFGKGYSPQKGMVDEAVKYAAANNVLLVHASGNESKNVDVDPRYPADDLLDGAMVDNWLNVGANTITNDLDIVAPFSNYGREDVDLFAPGMDIISLVPDNQYDMASGTSFASPVVAGVAALVWSHYPNLKASELKQLLMTSSHTVPKLKALYPVTGEKRKKKTKFSKMSVSGGVVNGYNALKQAETM